MGWGWGSTIYLCFCLFQVLLKVIQDANNKFKSLKKTNSLAVSRAHRVFGVWCDVCTQVHVCHQTCCTEVTLTVVSSSPILFSSPPLSHPSPSPLSSLPSPSLSYSLPLPPLPSPTPYPSLLFPLLLPTPPLLFPLLLPTPPLLFPLLLPTPPLLFPLLLPTPPLLFPLLLPTPPLLFPLLLPTPPLLFPLLLPTPPSPSLSYSLPLPSSSLPHR